MMDQGQGHGVIPERDEFVRELYVVALAIASQANERIYRR